MTCDEIVLSVALKKALVIARAGTDLYDAIEEIHPRVEGQPYADIDVAMMHADARMDLGLLAALEKISADREPEGETP